MRALRRGSINRIFSIGKMFDIPDGTRVSPFLNPLDVNETDLPIDLLGNISIAAGEVAPGVSSKIHCHPLVSQITWVVSGNLRVKMKEPADVEPYVLDLNPEQAVLTRPGSYFQLINPGSHNTSRVLYIVSPAYVFDADEEGVKYDDAVIADESWDELAAKEWKLPALRDLATLQKKRREAIERIAEGKTKVTSGN